MVHALGVARHLGAYHAGRVAVVLGAVNAGHAAVDDLHVERTGGRAVMGTGRVADTDIRVRVHSGRNYPHLPSDSSPDGSKLLHSSSRARDGCANQDNVLTGEGGWLKLPRT